MNIISKIKNLLLNLFRKGESCHYIHGPQTLPPPFTAEEESNILKMLDEKPKEVKEKLIIHNLRLVVYIAKKFESNNASIEDLISIGTIGLIKAVNTFRPEKNIKLATYASRCIENEILMHLRKTASTRYEISFDEPLNVDWDGNELLLSDVLGSDGDEIGSQVEQEAETRLLLSLVEKLDSRERKIMELRFGLSGQKEHTQKEVADMLGISQSYISRLEKRIIESLKKEILIRI